MAPLNPLSMNWNFRIGSKTGMSHVSTRTNKLLNGEPGFMEQWILLANSIPESIPGNTGWVRYRDPSEVVMEGESDVGVVDRLGVIT